MGGGTSAQSLFLLVLLMGAFPDGGVWLKSEGSVAP